MTISLTPNEQGRFGFNVKGGLDLDMPILVSRVAPNTPADRCYPKLNEGDQVCNLFDALWRASGIIFNDKLCVVLTLSSCAGCLHQWNRRERFVARTRGEFDTAVTRLRFRRAHINC